MPFFDSTTKRFALRIGLPAILILLATFVIVIVSLEKMAGEVNHIESELTGRSATAAVQSVLRHLGETNNDYAQWDDAVRNLYGAVNSDWAAENLATSTAVRHDLSHRRKRQCDCSPIGTASRCPLRPVKRLARRSLQ